MKKILYRSALGLFLLAAGYAQAQAFRYMDESGNIHFVDSVNEIPRRYRDQVLYPTAAPTGKPKRVRNTPTPKPTKRPKPTKTPKPPKKAKGKSFFPGSYPAPGQFPPTPFPGQPGSVVLPTQAPLPQQPLNPLQIAPGQFPPEPAAPKAPPSPTP